MKLNASLSSLMGAPIAPSPYFVYGMLAIINMFYGKREINNFPSFHSIHKSWNIYSSIALFNLSTQDLRKLLVQLLSKPSTHSFWSPSESSWLPH